MKVFYTTFILSVALIIGGFFCPPIGQIDGSVLTAIGFLVLFATVAKLPEAIKAGMSVKFTTDHFSAEIDAND